MAADKLTAMLERYGSPSAPEGLSLDALKFAPSHPVLDERGLPDIDWAARRQRVYDATLLDRLLDRRQLLGAALDTHDRNMGAYMAQAPEALLAAGAARGPIAGARAAAAYLPTVEEFARNLAAYPEKYAASLAEAKRTGSATLPKKGGNGRYEDDRGKFTLNKKQATERGVRLDNPPPTKPEPPAGVPKDPATARQLAQLTEPASAGTKLGVGASAAAAGALADEPTRQAIPSWLGQGVDWLKSKAEPIDVEDAQGRWPNEPLGGGRSAAEQFATAALVDRLEQAGLLGAGSALGFGTSYLTGHALRPSMWPLTLPAAGAVVTAAGAFPPALHALAAPYYGLKGSYHLLDKGFEAGRDAKYYRWLQDLQSHPEGGQDSMPGYMGRGRSANSTGSW